MSEVGGVGWMIRIQLPVREEGIEKSQAAFSEVRSGRSLAAAARPGAGVGQGSCRHIGSPLLPTPQQFMHGWLTCLEANALHQQLCRTCIVSSGSETSEQAPVDAEELQCRRRRRGPSKLPAENFYKLLCPPAGDPSPRPACVSNARAPKFQARSDRNGPPRSTRIARTGVQR